jgi:peroxiredoxin
MHPLHPAVLLAATALGTGQGLAAQRTLAALQQQFRAESQKLAASSPSQAQRDELLARHIGVLRTFADGEAKGDDLANARLMLADLELARGNRRAAGEHLAAIDADTAPALVLATAAAMAQHLGKTELRTACVDAALRRSAPLEDRLAVGRMLMTVLADVTRGEQVFTQALADAKDDEGRALVRWHRADALRDREDLPDNAAFDEFQKLADELPATYWGAVAKDRLRATRLRQGEPAIDFKAKALDGTEVSLAALRGKAVVLVFWSAPDRDNPTLLAALAQARKAHGDALAVLGVCLDRDPAGIEIARKELGIDFPVIGDGKGLQTDATLRWFVEGPAVHVVGRDGNVAALGLHAGTADARTELADAIARAVKAESGAR